MNNERLTNQSLLIQRMNSVNKEFNSHLGIFTLSVVIFVCIYNSAKWFLVYRNIGTRCSKAPSLSVCVFHTRTTHANPFILSLSTQPPLASSGQPFRHGRIGDRSGGLLPRGEILFVQFCHYRSHLRDIGAPPPLHTLMSRFCVPKCFAL